MKLILFAILIACLAACSNSPANSNSANNVTAVLSPSPKPTVSNEEKEEIQKAKNEFNKAINEFIAKNYAGWQLKGISDEYDCREFSSDPCNLLLVSGLKEKVVAVMVKRFTQSDGQTRLVVFEARPIDLSKAKIEKVKEDVLNNLETDDCASICDAREDN